ncbi:MAG: hypothetical protein QOJ99_4064, partial [Bryobacterales bacterium]|nr:hypothetical protein [Bryobacterales bacterium]
MFVSFANRVKSAISAPSPSAIVAVAALSCLPLANAQTAPAPQTAESQKLVKQYCVGCHNSKLKSASLSLESLDLSKVSDDAGLWEKVLRKVEAKQMPPMGMPHPDPAAQKAFTSYLETELDRAAAAHPNPGRPTIHRVNRNEYSNAVRDLLALDIKPGNTLPLDDTGYGFDNIGDVLSLSPILIERYMTMARTVARLAVGDTEIKPVIDIFTPVKEVRAASKGGPRLPRNERVSEDLPFDSAGGISFDYSFPVDAQYTFKIKMPSPALGFGETAAPIGQVFDLKIPVKAGVHHIGLTFMRSGAIPEILPQLPAARAAAAAGGRGPAPVLPTAHMDLRLDGARLQLYDVKETTNGPNFSELAIGGPYEIVGAGNSPSRQKIFVCNPASAQEELPCARKILSTLARQAYRRPVTEGDIKPLLAFYQTGRKPSEISKAPTFNTGIEMALRAMLVSPNFLFRIERDPAGAAPGSVHRVNDYELASRLSFFLWSSIPDEELLTLAGQ